MKKGWELGIGTSTIVASSNAMGGPVFLRIGEWGGKLHIVLVPVDENGNPRFDKQAECDRDIAREKIVFRDWRDVIV